jgi:hypothetical protein
VIQRAASSAANPSNRLMDHVDDMAEAIQRRWVRRLAKRMADSGVLDGRDMSLTVISCGPTDLIWS